MPTPTPFTAQISGLGKLLSASISPRNPYLPGFEVGVGDHGLHLGEVGAGAEAAAGARQQHHRDLWVVGGGQQRFGGGVVEGFVESVERLGPIQRQRAHRVVVLRVCSTAASLPRPLL